MTAVVVVAMGCSSGESTEEAQTYCNELAEADKICMTAEATSACVSCREECGSDCDSMAGCPLSFKCAEE